MDVYTLLGQRNSIEGRPRRWSFDTGAEAAHPR
jgi:hypothetical protein